MNSFEYKEEYLLPTHACLNVTDACNLACRYCFVEQHPNYMSLQVAKDAVDYLVENIKKRNKNEKGLVVFFGGEPMLLYEEIIVPLVNYVKENNFPLGFSMTTNGTLLNEERIKFLYDNNFKLLFSMDGDEEVQNFNRPCQNPNLNSYDLVQKNIPILLKYFPNVTFRATIYSKSVENTFNSYIFAIKQGFKNIFLMPDCRHSWTEEEKEKLHQEIHKIYSFLDYCFTIKQQFPPINCKVVNESFSKFLQHDLQLLKHKGNFNKYKKRNIVRCGLAANDSVAIGYDGSIMSCQEQISKCNKDNIFYLGSLYDKGIEKERHLNLLKKYNDAKITKCENIEQCKKCYFNETCVKEHCPSTTWDLFNEFHCIPEILCLWHEWLTLDAIILNNKMFQEENLIFKEYLNTICNFKIYNNKQNEVK